MLFRWLKNLFSSASAENLLIGEVFKERNLITAEQLDTALNAQKEKLKTMGMAVPLARIIVDMGFASEEKLVEAINDHYKVTIHSLSDITHGIVGKNSGIFSEEYRLPRFPIWFQLSVTMMFILLVFVLSLFFVISDRQHDKFYSQAMDTGVVSLNFFGKNAGIPLLNEDILALNTLLKNAEGVDGHLYAFITNNEKIIMAHTDQSLIGTPVKPFYQVRRIFKKDEVTYFDYVMDGSRHVLNMSAPIVFDGKQLGEVHVGISIDFIDKLFIQEKSFLALCCLVAVVVGLIVAVIFGLRYSRPISLLVRATRAISGGDYNYKVKINRNDELSRLAHAFNQMGSELSRQSMMKEMFGKYVGTEILDMIMNDTENQWLKGRKNKATILFADIRNFTAYSETREPEQVVEKLNEFFDIATRVILKHGGYIDKFIGDAVLGVFGVPVYCIDHTERCIRAAIDMQNALSQASGTGNELLSRVGIGIKTGTVVAGNIGSHAKMEYTVVGDSVNIASRLNGFAMPGEIIVDQSVCDQLKEKLEFVVLAPQKIKGRSEPVQIFKVTGFKEEGRTQKR